MMMDNYSNDYLKAIFDTKLGAGYCDYVVKAFRYYLENNTPESN